MLKPILAVVAVLLGLGLGILLAKFDASQDSLVSFWNLVDRKTYEWFIDDCLNPEQVAEVVAASSHLGNEVHVVYSTEESGFDGLLISMLSLSKHSAAPSEVTIHIIVRRGEMLQASRIVECFKDELGAGAAIPIVKLHPLQPIALNLTSFQDVWEDYWPAGKPMLTPFSFVQLYLPDYLPKTQRAVWLHSETIVKADVARLYRTPMKTALAASLDIRSVTWQSAYSRDVEDLAGIPLTAYGLPDLGARTLSSGVLVLDLERWRANNLTQKLEEWVQRMSGVKASQLALNLEFREKFDVLDWRWNVMGLMMIPPDRCLEEGRIFHWPGPGKPSAPSLPERLQGFYRKLSGPFAPRKPCSTGMMLDSDFDVSA